MCGENIPWVRRVNQLKSPSRIFLAVTMTHRRSTVLLAVFSLLSCLPANLFVDLSCLTPRFNGRETSMDLLVETDEYRLVAESTTGAKGDVVPVALWLHSNLENPG